MDDGVIVRGVTMVAVLFCVVLFEVLSSGGVGHRWCTGAQVVHKWCTGGAQVVHRWCTGGAQMVHRWCTDGAQMVHTWCTQVKLPFGISITFFILISHVRT
jgi:hypothetical protein